jgi:hypothetical protein
MVVETFILLVVLSEIYYLVRWYGIFPLRVGVVSSVDHGGKVIPLRS